MPYTQGGLGSSYTYRNSIKGQDYVSFNVSNMQKPTKSTKPKTVRSKFVKKRKLVYVEPEEQSLSEESMSESEYAPAQPKRLPPMPQAPPQPTYAPAPKQRRTKKQPRNIYNTQPVYTPQPPVAQQQAAAPTHYANSYAPTSLYHSNYPEPQPQATSAQPSYYQPTAFAAPSPYRTSRAQY